MAYVATFALGNVNCLYMKKAHGEQGSGRLKLTPIKSHFKVTHTHTHTSLDVQVMPLELRTSEFLSFLLRLV